MVDSTTVPHRTTGVPRPRTPTGAVAVVFLALVILSSAHAGGGAVAFTPRSATIANEGATIVLRERGNERSYDIERWRAWARENLEAQVQGPLAIGPQPVAVADFDRFGTAAVSPDGGRVFFSVTTYAMLTTLSLVGTLDPAGFTVTMLPVPRRGQVESPVWSPSGSHVAYALATARGHGESLHADHVEARRSAFTLTRQEMYAAWTAVGVAPLDGAGGPDAYRPAFRDPSWLDEGRRLAFTVDRPGTSASEQEAAARDASEQDATDQDATDQDGTGRRWSVAADGSDLRPVDSGAAAP